MQTLEYSSIRRNRPAWGRGVLCMRIAQCPTWRQWSNEPRPGVSHSACLASTMPPNTTCQQTTVPPPLSSRHRSYLEQSHCLQTIHQPLLEIYLNFSLGPRIEKTSLECSDWKLEFFETTALVSVVTPHETKYKSTVELLGGFWRA